MAVTKTKLVTSITEAFARMDIIEDTGTMFAFWLAGGLAEIIWQDYFSNYSQFCTSVYVVGPNARALHFEKEFDYKPTEKAQKIDEGLRSGCPENVLHFGLITKRRPEYDTIEINIFLQVSDHIIKPNYDLFDTPIFKDEK